MSSSEKKNHKYFMEHSSKKNGNISGKLQKRKSGNSTDEICVIFNASCNTRASHSIGTGSSFSGTRAAETRRWPLIPIHSRDHTWMTSQSAQEQLCLSHLLPKHDHMNHSVLTTKSWTMYVLHGFETETVTSRYVRLIRNREAIVAVNSEV